MNVVEKESDRETGTEFLEDWSQKQGIEADFVVTASGNVEEAIEKEAEKHTLVIMGASERGLFERLIQGTVVEEVVEDLDCSVIIAEKNRKRTLLEKIFGLK